MIKDILQGITTYFKAFGLIRKLNLGKFFFVPIIISLVIGTGIMAIAYALSDDIGGIIAKIWVWEWGKEAFTGFANFIGGFSIFVIGFVLYKHIVMALASPFMSPVSEKIEMYFHQQNGNLSEKLIHRKTNFAEQLARGVRINIRNLTKEILLTILLLICSFIPVINLITTPLLFGVQSYYAGFGSMDYTLERHFNYKDSIQFVSKNKGVALGNGLVFMALLLVPIVGFIIVLPLSVTASSLKTIEKIYKNKV